eukprot:scaffold3255_cov86-Isochrysis_galbana.AAC.1
MPHMTHAASAQPPAASRRDRGERRATGHRPLPTTACLSEAGAGRQNKNKPNLGADAADCPAAAPARRGDAAGSAAGRRAGRAVGRPGRAAVGRARNVRPAAGGAHPAPAPIAAGRLGDRCRGRCEPAANGAPGRTAGAGAAGRRALLGLVGRAQPQAGPRRLRLGGRGRGGGHVRRRARRPDHRRSGSDRAGAARPAVVPAGRTAPADSAHAPHLRLPQQHPRVRHAVPGCCQLGRLALPARRTEAAADAPLVRHHAGRDAHPHRLLHQPRRRRGCPQARPHITHDHVWNHSRRCAFPLLRLFVLFFPSCQSARAREPPAGMHHSPFHPYTTL